MKYTIKNGYKVSALTLGTVQLGILIEKLALAVVLLVARHRGIGAAVEFKIELALPAWEKLVAVDLCPQVVFFSHDLLIGDLPDAVAQLLFHPRRVHALAFRVGEVIRAERDGLARRHHI